LPDLDSIGADPFADFGLEWFGDAGDGVGFVAPSAEFLAWRPERDGDTLVGSTAADPYSLPVGMSFVRDHKGVLVDADAMEWVRWWAVKIFGKTDDDRVLYLADRVAEMPGLRDVNAELVSGWWAAAGYGKKLQEQFEVIAEAPSVRPW